MANEPQRGLTVVLEAPVQTPMINVTLPAILRHAPPESPVCVVTSTACAAALRRELVRPDTVVLAYDNFNANPRVELDVIRRCTGVVGVQVVALREQDLLRAARIRRHLGLPGMSPESVSLFRDKLLMKQRAERAGIAVPQFMAVDTGADLARAMERYAYPWIVKPRRKAAGMGFRVLRSESDVRALLDELAPKLDWDEALDLIAEEFVGTEMFHVDGVWSGSTFQRLVVAEYLGLKPHHDVEVSRIAEILSGSLEVPTADPWHAPLKAFTDKLLTVLGYGSCFAFHAEIWRRDGQLLLNEVACRTGGGQVYFLQQEVFGVNPDEMHLAALQGRLAPWPLDELRPVRMVARIPPRPGRYSGPLKPLPDGTRLQMFQAGEVQFQAPRTWHDAVGFAYAEGSTREETLRRTELAIDVFSEAVTPC